MLTISCNTLFSERRQFRVSIEYSLDHPEGGIQFVIPKGEGTMAEVRVMFAVITINFAHYG